jgi:nucleoside-diphosphate-sugar epimerase
MGFQHVIPEMFVKLSQSSNVDVVSPHHTRAYCYIDDAVEMTIRITEDQEASCQVYNIGNQEQEIDVVDLVRSIANVMGVKPSITEMEDIA